MSLPTVLERLQDALETVAGVATVLVGPVEAPVTGNARLPVLIIDVARINIQRSTVEVWEYEIDLYYLHAERGRQGVTVDLASELATLYPVPKTIVDALNGHMTLGGATYGWQYATPAIDGPGVIAWKDRQYAGCVLHVIAKEKYTPALTG